MKKINKRILLAVFGIILIQNSIVCQEIQPSFTVNIGSYKIDEVNGITKQNIVSIPSAYTSKQYDDFGEMIGTPICFIDFDIKISINNKTELLSFFKLLSQDIKIKQENDNVNLVSFSVVQYSNAKFIEYEADFIDFKPDKSDKIFRDKKLQNRILKYGGFISFVVRIRYKEEYYIKSIDFYFKGIKTKAIDKKYKKALLNGKIVLKKEDCS